MASVQGDKSHDAVDNSSAPLKIGGVAKSSAPTAVSDGDRVNAYFDTSGIQHVAVDTFTATVTVSDGGGTITVDDGATTLSVDDGGGSITVDGTVGINSVPASARTTDSISAVLATDTIMNNLTALTPKFAKASISASTTDGAVVAAVTSKKIRVLSAVISAGATASTVKFTTKPAGAGTQISLNLQPANNGGAVLPFSPVGWFESASGEGLSATTGAGSTTEIQVTYVEV